MKKVRGSKSSSKAAQACSASTIVAHAVDGGQHLLKIDRYSLTQGVPNGRRIESRPFTGGGHRWSLIYYPNGNCHESRGYISLFICLKDDVADAVQAQFTLTLLDMAGGTKPIHRPRAGDGLYGRRQRHWGYEKYISREELEASGHLKDDAFTISCDVTVIEVRVKDVAVASVVAPPPPVPPSDLARHLGGLLLAGDGADVTFIVGGEKVAAHRCVLAARSPVFRAELLAGMRESVSSRPIPIEDMEAAVFRAMLHFIYTDSLQETVTAADDAATYLPHLLVAADRYDVPRLKLACESVLCDHVGAENADALLALAKLYRCRGLQMACSAFLRSASRIKDNKVSTFKNLVPRLRRLSLVNVFKVYN